MVEQWRRVYHWWQQGRTGCGHTASTVLKTRPSACFCMHCVELRR